MTKPIASTVVTGISANWSAAIARVNAIGNTNDPRRARRKTRILIDAERREGDYELSALWMKLLNRQRNLKAILRNRRRAKRNLAKKS
jgi:hypothetical protein